MNDTMGSQAVQLRVEALMGRALDTLEALLTDPALPADRRAELALRLLDIALVGEPGATPPTPPAGLLPARCFTIRDFLPPDLHAAAVTAAEQLRDRFVASGVTSGEAGYRRSRVLFEDAMPALYQAMCQEIATALPAIGTALLRPGFAPGHVEMQMTVHGDGDFFRIHNDNAGPEIAYREITFVYYFLLRQPCGFHGGALRLYETMAAEPPHFDPDRYADIVPEDNMIVFFDSRLMHEVLKLDVPSGMFEDARFTLNGWLHARRPAAPAG